MGQPILIGLTREQLWFLLKDKNLDEKIEIKQGSFYIEVFRVKE